MKTVSLNHRLKIKWIIAAMDLIIDLDDREEIISRMEAILRSDLKGEESFKKSIRYIRHLILQPTGEFEQLRDQAIEIYRGNRNLKTAQVISYFLIIAQYPYLREVAEVCGKLLNIQSSFKTEQIRRKMIEIHGDRELIRRSSRNAVSILNDLELLVSSGKKGVYESNEPFVFGNIKLAEFALKAWFMSFDENVPRAKSAILNDSSFFAFDANSFTNFALQGDQFTLSRQSFDEDIIALKK